MIRLLLLFCLILPKLGFAGVYGESTSGSLYGLSEGAVYSAPYVGGGGGDVTPPGVSTCTLNGGNATIVFTEVVDLSGYDAGDFEIDCDGASGSDVDLAYSSGSGGTYHFTMTAIGEDETCTLEYDADVSADDMEDLAGNDLLTFTGKATTNDSAAPTVVAVSISQSGIRATIEHSEIVVTTGYDNGDYELDCTVTGNDIDLNNISGSGTTREFDIDGVIVHEDVCTLEYDADVSADDIEDVYGVDLGTFSGQAVTNNVPVNPPGDTDYHYCTQSGAGTRDGSSLANAFAASDFNNASNWDTDADNDNRIGPGDTVYFSGTITSTVIPVGSGTSGNRIVLDGYENGNCDPIVSECTSSAILNQGMKIGSLSSGVGPDYITVQDFRMTRTGENDSAFSALAPDGQSADYIMFRRNSISEAPGQMLQFYRMKYAVIDNNKAVIFGQTYDVSKGVNFTYMYNSIVSNNEFGNDENNYPSVCTSANLVELHGCHSMLFEYNNLYGSPNQRAIEIKESYAIDDIIIRYNKIHNHGTYWTTGIRAGGGIKIGGAQGGPTIENIYMYGNFIYNTWQWGILAQADTSEYLYIWSNLVASNGQSGICVSSTRGDPQNIWVYNNTVVKNGDREEADDSRGGIVIVGGDYYNIKNNILWNNRPSGAGGKYFQFYNSNTSTITSLDYNTLWHDTSQAALYDWLGTSRDNSWMVANTAFCDNDNERDVDFTDPDGVDNIFGTVDDDYSLQAGSNEINDAADVSFSENIDLSNSDSWFETLTGYTTISMTGNEALDPDTDWSGQPSATKILIVDRDVVGWDRGAYAYE
jgi:hypothetical protein